MRYNLKKQLLNTLDIMQEAQDIAKLQVQLGNYETVLQIYTQLQQLAVQAGNAVEEDCQYATDVIEMLEQYCEIVYSAAIATQDTTKYQTIVLEMQNQYQKLCTYVTDIKEKIKIVFMPYNITMWDALESIWIAAKQDDRCECYVMPIPYYDVVGGKLGAYHYHGSRYPSNIQIVDYKNYNIEKEKPDIIYYHNPYDNQNLLTSIEPKYYTVNLKKIGSMLVYVPYYISNYGLTECDIGPGFTSSGVANSDYIIVQSDMHAKACELAGNDKSKFVITGSPKVDALKKYTKEKTNISEHWVKVLQKRKVILMNTSIRTFLNVENWLLEVSKIAQEIISDNQLALIWRPHPLLETTIKEMRPHMLGEYLKFISILQKADNVVFDVSDTVNTAMAVSDAMLSDYSSLIRQYIFTEKPILVFAYDQAYIQRNKECEYFSNLFYDKGLSIKEFINIIKSGDDWLKEKRTQYAYQTIENADGMCGEKTHSEIIKKLLKE